MFHLGEKYSLGVRDTQQDRRPYVRPGLYSPTLSVGEYRYQQLFVEY
jgi:hypothetical protein